MGRIEQFLYTNVIPTGLNYQSGMLLSTVYFKGAEYPYSMPINKLPLYVGKSLDSVTTIVSSAIGENADTISKDCADTFNEIYCNFEKRLGAINSKITKAAKDFIYGALDCLEDWISLLMKIFGINLIVTYLTDLYVTLGISSTSIVERINSIKALVTKEMLENIFFNENLDRQILGQREKLKVIEEILFSGYHPSGSGRKLTNAQKETLRLLKGDIEKKLRYLLTIPKRNITSFSTLVQHELKNIKEIIRANFSKFSGGIRGALQTFGVIFVGLVSSTIGNLRTLLLATGRVFPYVALAILLGSLANLVVCLNQKCENWTTTVRNAEQIERYAAANQYYDDMEDAIKSGCCDKGSGSGSGIQGVGLTLLMGNKYIPTYYDNINQNYMNTNVEATPGQNEFKKNCPPRSGYGGSTPGPDCTKCGLVNGYEDPTTSYAINSWTVCGPGCTGDTPDTSANTCQVMTSYGVFVHSHRCACGWDPDPQPIPCNFGDIYEAFASSLSSLPGVIDGIISSGGAIGV